MPVENPCIGCRSQITHKISPCCHDNVMRLSIAEYNAHFVGKPGVVVLGPNDDTWMGEGVLLSYEDNCPNLDTDTGLCQVQETKPLACRDMEPYTHPLCRKTPGGRQ